MTNTLQHVGVLGMRWGHRKSTSSSDYEISRKIKKKKLHEMSNEELKTLTSRLQLEQQYKNLNPSKVQRGAKLMGVTLGTIGKVTAGLGTILALSASGKKLYKAWKTLNE